MKKAKTLTIFVSKCSRCPYCAEFDHCGERRLFCSKCRKVTNDKEFLPDCPLKDVDVEDAESAEVKHKKEIENTAV
jgi:hypothetical protein